MGKAKLKVGDVEAALRATAGIYSAAAEKLGCAPNTVKNYVERHKALRQVCEEVTERTLDLAESKLLKQINKDNLTAIIFYLKTKGKHRGYVERQENTGPNGGPVPHVVRFPDRAPDAETWAAQHKPAGD